MASGRDKRRADGSTAFQVLWRKPDGTQTSKTFDDPNIRDMFLRLMNDHGDDYAAVDRAIVRARATAPTIEAVMAHHLDTLSGVEPGTIHRYRQLNRNHIQPALGAFPVDALTRVNVTDWFNALPVAAKTRKNIHALLSAGLETAVKDRRVGENVAKGVRDSKAAQIIRTRENVFLSKPEFEALCAAFDPRYVLFLRVLAGTGLRFSEATALRKRDLKLTSGRFQAHIIRAWKKTGEGYVIGGPKTVRGKRTVALPKGLTDPVTAHLARLKANELVFTLPDGGRLANNRFHDTYWDEVVDGLVADGTLHDTPTIHDLRHTSASWLLRAGVPILTVSRRLGHNSIQVTVDTYGHIMNTDDSDAADLLD